MSAVPPHLEVAALVFAHRFERFLPKGDLPAALDEDGTRLCRWCRARLDRRSIAWCSDECADEFWIRTSRLHVMRIVHARDQGVCGRCGLDTERWLRVLAELRRRSERRRLSSGTLHEPTDLEAGRWERARRALGERGFGAADAWHFPRLWEADHVVAVVEGGGCCGAENYRTLCVPCHREETRKLRGRLRSCRVSHAANRP